jgi:hypothetical protein
VAVGVGSDNLVYAVAGAPGVNSSAGAFRVFQYTSSWILGGVSPTLPTLAASDNFGSSVAIQGDTLVVGAPGPNPATATGHVYTYSRGAANSWSSTKSLEAANELADNQFGRAVSLDAGRLVVGGRKPGQQGGQAYFYQGSAAEWNGEIMRMASNTHPTNGFGFAISTSGGRTIVGALQQNTSVTNSGAAYFFE